MTSFSAFIPALMYLHLMYEWVCLSFFVTKMKKVLLIFGQSAMKQTQYA